MKIKTSIILAAVLVGTVATLISISTQQATERRVAGRPQVRFQLQWIHQAQFAGFYVAVQKGFYREQGIDVELIPGAFNVNPILKLVSGDVDIGMATGDQVLLKAADGLSLKAVGTVFRRSVACFVSHNDRSLDHPIKLKGKKVAVFYSYDTDNVLRSLLRKEGIDSNQVDIVPASGNLQQLIGKDVDAYGAYLFNEPLALADLGVKATILDPDKFGVRFYSDTIIATEDYIGKNRDTLKRFLRASAQGWKYAAEHPEEAVALMLKHVPDFPADEMSQKRQVLMCKTATGLLNANGVAPLVMDAHRWEDMSKALKQLQKLPESFRADKYVDHTLLAEINQ
jgi:NitT/TauT family transport system substrate-binding protein